jgi:hypothetical protein
MQIISYIEIEKKTKQSTTLIRNEIERKPLEMKHSCFWKLCFVSLAKEEKDCFRCPELSYPPSVFKTLGEKYYTPLVL